MLCLELIHMCTYTKSPSAFTIAPRQGATHAGTFEGRSTVGRRLDRQTAEKAVLGSAILGGGSGTTIETGIRLGQIAVELGDARLADADELSPDAEIAAVATVQGQPGNSARYRLSYHARALELLTLNTGTEFDGLVCLGDGADSAMVGWSQAALLGTPLVDAAFEGRLYPDALHSFIDLLSDTVSLVPVAAVGCGTEGDDRQEVFVRGTPQSIGTMLETLRTSGGSYALTMGPLSMAWVGEEADGRRISRAIEVGEVLLEATGDGGRVAAGAVRRALRGDGVVCGTVTGVIWETLDAVPCARLLLRDEEGRDVELLHWHRYVGLEVAGERVASFPDLIVTLGARGTPLHARELSKGQDAYIVVAPAVTPASGPANRDWASYTGLNGSGRAEGSGRRDEERLFDTAGKGRG
jgi:DUF917 family protein